MRALQTRRHHPLFRSGELIEKSTREPKLPRQASHRVSLLANPKVSDRLDSWKEIASHLKRTVRTVQRWEKYEALPVHRHLHHRANSVYAQKSELDEWWNSEPHCDKIEKPKVPSERSQREVSSSQTLKVIRHEMGNRKVSQTLLPSYLEYFRESPETEMSFAEDGTGAVVCVLRVRIPIAEYLLQPRPERTARDTSVPCRTWRPA